MTEERAPWVSRALVLVLVAMGLVAALFTFLRQRSDGDGTFHPEHSYVAVTQDGKIEKREGDGTLIRLMREDLAVEALDPGDGVQIAVTPDGRYAYHDAALTACNEVELRAIARVDLVRGFTEVAAVGQAPAISADGRKLAYVTDGNSDGEPFATLDGERPVCGDVERGDAGDANVLVVRDLGDRTEVRWGPPANGLGLPRWLADNRQLSIGRGFERVVLDTTQTDADIGGLRPARDVGGYRPLEFVDREQALGADCYVKKSEKRTPLPPKVEKAYAGSCEFSFVDAADMSKVKHVATLRAFGDNLRIADLDPAGERLLAGWAVRDESVLLSYVLGAERATVLGEGVVAAAWLTN